MKSGMSIARYSQLLAPVVSNLRSPEFSAELMLFFKSLQPFNNTVMLVYTANQQPVVAYNDTAPAHQERGIEAFRRGAYLLDPYYRAARDKKASGFYHLDQLAPDAFEETEYYRNYYRYTSLTVECGYLVHIDDKTFVNVSLGHSGKRRPLGEFDFNMLAEIEPLIAALARDNWSDWSASQQPQGLNEQLEGALTRFGTAFLTGRESQVVQLFLHGHSTKSIAERLGISPETVKLHRKNSYAKLDVSSQAELFYLFIDSLSNIESYTGGDPLVGYLNHS